MYFHKDCVLSRDIIRVMKTDHFSLLFPLLLQKFPRELRVLSNQGKILRRLIILHCLPEHIEVGIS